MTAFSPKHSGLWVSGRACSCPVCHGDAGNLQRLYLRVQTALVASCLIFVHQAFSGHVVEHRYCRRVGVRCCGFVTCCNCRHHTLNVGTHHRALTGIAGASAFRLTRAFLSLGRIRQDNLLEKLKIQPNSIVRGRPIVNRLQAFTRRSLYKSGTCTRRINHRSHSSPTSLNELNTRKFRGIPG